MTMAAEEVKTVLHHSDVPITRRQAVTHDPLAQVLDRLLLASCELPPTATIEEAAAALVQVGWEALGDAAVGVCIPDGSGGQIVVRRSPRHSHTQAPDPTHLFPEYVHERVVPIPYDEGSTLHVATNDELRLSSDPAIEAGSSRATTTDAIIDRLALSLGAAIRHCRSSERSRDGEAEMRGLQAQVIQSEKLASLGQIAAGIVHELNNPLTSIVAYSDYLRKKVEKSGGDPQDVERLLRINEAADRILRFSRDLIAYSRPSPEVPGAVVIHDVIERALVFCEHVIEVAGVDVEKGFADVPPVRGVAGQLTQVFVNLLTNACQAMAAGGGRIAISTALAADGAEVVVTIRDDGQGIDPEALPRIFDPFFTTKTDGGTGLGLSIVRNIISGHGGKIAASAAEPRGTIFHLVLPVAG